MKKTLSILVPICCLLFAVSVSAHVVVKPNQAGVAAFQVFTMGVPSEKDVPTTSVRLVLPDGLNFVTPNVKPGWKVEVKQQATGKKITDDDGMQVDEMKPIEIDWTGGAIPGGQRDEFVFQAQTPASATTLNWKAYQTYSDGSVVSWDQAPGANVQAPYSQTKIVNDLMTTPTTTATNSKSKENTASLAISIAALVLAVFAVARKKPAANNNPQN